MNIPDDSIVVNEIAGNFAIIFCNRNDGSKQLEEYGFTKCEGIFTKKIDDESDRIKLIEFLIDKNSLFSSGNDWSPEQLILFLRENGKLNRKFKVITWSGSGQYSIADK